MAANRQRTRNPMLSVRPDRPLIGVVLIEDGEEVVRYFTNEADADAVVAQSPTDVRSLAGAWADLDWDEADDEFDRIRHESEPTPPVDKL